MRLFIAVDMPDEIVAEAKKVQALLQRKKFFKGKFVDGDGMHITIKFLGDVDESQLPAIDAALQKIRYAPMQAELGAADFFSAESHIKIIFLRLICPALGELARAIDASLAGMFEKEPRAFVSHLSLVRVRQEYNTPALMATINALKIPRISCTISEFVLKKSEPSGNGSVYTDIKRYPLR
jgi:2'-5' RNA ligase